MFATRTEKPLSREELRQRRWAGVPCFFVLSTGRCGTRTLAHILDLGQNAQVHHEPLPRLNRQCREAYEKWEEAPSLFTLLIEACREDLVYRAYESGQIYGETANRLTYFAPAIEQVFSEARFLHLVRDPREVVRSGMDRGWYDGNKWDEGRIVPRPGDPCRERWDGMTLFEKCAWFWVETCRFARDFLASLPPERSLFLKSEDLFSGDPELLRRVFDFLEIDPPRSREIARVLRKKENFQRRRSFPETKRWSPEQAGTLREIAGPLMEEFGYAG